MQFELFCPHCGPTRVDSMSYDRIILFSQQLALASYICPRCSMKITFSGKIPPEVREDVEAVLAQENVTIPHRRFPLPYMPGRAQGASAGQGGCGCGNAGCGCGTGSDPAKAAGVDASTCDCATAAAGSNAPAEQSAPENPGYLEYFKHQLDSIETVDDLLVEIDATDSPKED